MELGDIGLRVNELEDALHRHGHESLVLLDPSVQTPGLILREDILGDLLTARTSGMMRFG